MDSNAQHPSHGQIGYVQIPTVDLAQSIAFYRAVFGWSAEIEYGSFEAPGVIGQFTTDHAPANGAGPVIWICADNMSTTLQRVEHNGGRVRARPQLDQGARWLAEIDDPTGNRLGIVFPVGPPQAQPLIAVRDVEASSRWYQHLLGLTSDHGGPHYERLLAAGALVLQIHHHETEHHHGPISDASYKPGNGPLLWFGEVADFDDTVTRANNLGARVIMPVHRNPPEGQGNGPAHRELWIEDPDGYTIVIASPDGEAHEPEPRPDA